MLVEGLQKEGKLYTIDINEELQTMSQSFKAGIEDMVVQYVGNALNIIPTISDEFDLAFIDVDKEKHSDLIVIDKMPIGGFIIADNVSEW